MRNKKLILAILIGCLSHAILVPFSFENTYDANIHLFFADHYAKNWFNLWESRWYTGFSVSSYPPLVHQLLALLSFVGGLKFAFCLWAVCVMAFLMVGVYRFSCLLVSNHIAVRAAFLAAFMPSILQSLHIYGQLPTLTGISFLLNALPDLYAFIRWKKPFNLLRGLGFIAVTVVSHHVTPLFGMVFFIAPVASIAVFDQYQNSRHNIKTWVSAFWANRLHLVILFGSMIGILVFAILPYWLYSRENPITQVPIPHGSRDAFWRVLSSGKMFFLLPYGFLLLLLPYIFRQYFTKRLFFMGISLVLLVLLGTGGSTPIPKMLLGNNAFQILTLDRFTFWATVLCIPFVAQFLTQCWNLEKRLLVGLVGLALIGQTAYLIHLGRFQSLQPAKINMQPIVNFLATDQHDHWRYLTLGFGDQMAWLSVLTNAQTVDGNYHSARRLPELTKYPIERLENAKHGGGKPIESLRLFVFNPDKYSLKYIFSNDKFYDPLLFFAGWERTIRLSNGVVVWEKLDIPPLNFAFQDTHHFFPLYQTLLWGILPVSLFLLMLGLVLYGLFSEQKNIDIIVDGALPKKILNRFDTTWAIILLTSLCFIKNQQEPKNTPEEAVRNYLHNTDFRFFDRAYQNLIDQPSYQSYLLQLSVSDGLLASYSKLDTVRFRKKYTKKGITFLVTYIVWHTSMGQYIEEKVFKLRQKGDQWKILYEPLQDLIPPDRTLEETDFAVFSHGKRQISTEPAPADDILDRPEIEIIHANLIRNGSCYSIVGELKNTDHLAASIHIEGFFLDSKQTVLYQDTPKNKVIYKLLPQESSPFRIDFIGKNKPTNFRVHARAVITTEAIYRNLGYQNLYHNARSIQGVLLNYGTKTAIIPTLTTAFYNTQKQIFWVDSQILPENIRIQQARNFEVALPNFNNIELIQAGNAAHFLVNGIKKTNTEQLENTYLELIPQGYLQIKTNAFIANNKN